VRADRVRGKLLQKSLHATAFGALLLAQAWDAPAAEDARVLPQGRSRLAIVYARASGITEEYNPFGEAESLVAPYNLELSASAIRDFEPQINDLINFLNTFDNLRYNSRKRDNGYYGITEDPNDPLLGDALSRGFLAVDAEAERNQWMFSYMYGVTDKLSLGVVVPYLKTSVRVNAGLHGVNVADDIYHYFAGNNPGAFGQVQDGLDDLRSVNTETFQSLLAEKGYSRFEDSQQSGIGDVVLGGRYNHYNHKQWLHSVQAGISLPTGQLRSPSNLTEVDAGIGAWSLTMSHISNYNPITPLSLSGSVNYTHRFPSHRWLRVRPDPATLIPGPEDEEDLDMRLGNKFWLKTGAGWAFNDVFSVDADYEWEWKNEDRYYGTKLDRDYTYLSDDTASYKETLQLGASVSSVQAFLGKRFPLPGKLSLMYSLPVRGRNSLITPFAAAELNLYF
jgi:hypothetical protein